MIEYLVSGLVVYEQIKEKDYIEVIGVWEYNFKNIDLQILCNKMVVIMGISGSGKFFLVFDIIYVEGQCCYMEIFIFYVWQFIGEMECLEVEKINGFSLVIFIE